MWKNMRDSILTLLKRAPPKQETQPINNRFMPRATRQRLRGDEGDSVANERLFSVKVEALNGNLEWKGFQGYYNKL